MAIYKLLDDFYEHSYTLIAIHGSLDDYRLAYFLNLVFKNLDLSRFFLWIYVFFKTVA